MKRLLMTATVLFLSSGRAFVAAQTPSPATPPRGTAASPNTKAPPTQAQGLNPDATNYGMGPGMMGPGMMGPGMMGPMGMMGMCPGAAGTPRTGTMMGWGMMGSCPGMSGLATKVQVSKQPKGASMVITADDPQVVARLQTAADNGGGCMMGGHGHMMGQGMMGQGTPGCCGAGSNSGTPPTNGAPAAGTGTCAGMMGPGTDVKVTKVAKGVSFSMTGSDAKAVARVQKMAEAMRLMHDASQL
jgi:hypothetical protein